MGTNMTVEMLEQIPGQMLEQTPGQTALPVPFAPEPIDTAYIVIRQLPIIEEQLAALSEEIERRVTTALSLDCTEETVKEVKKIRTALSKDFALFEERRKQVKTAILTPYNDFEEIYKSCVMDPYKYGDAQLKEKIDAVENGLKQLKRDELKIYFDELCVAYAVDCTTFERWNPNVTQTTSLKSLKDQAYIYVTRIAEEIAAISAMEHRDEIWVEYQKTLNLAQSVSSVDARKKAIEEAKRKKAETEARKAAEREAIAIVEAALPPPEARAPLIPPVAQPVSPATLAPAAKAPKPEKDPKERLYVVFEIEEERQTIQKIGSYFNEMGIKYRIIEHRKA